jgi:hypothetical protein
VGGVSALYLAGCQTAKEQTREEPPAFRHVLIGIGEDYPKESRSLGAAQRDLEVLKTNGIHVLRISFAWDAMEPERWRFDWSFWDDYVRMATEEYGMQLIHYVCYTPRWATDRPEDFWREPPTNNVYFAEFVAALVQRYKNRIHSWELWNEPDNPDYWRGTVQQFENLLNAGGQAVHRSDPRARVVMGGLAWNLDFLAAVLTNEPAIHDVNAFNLHNYYETWSSEPVEHIPDYLGRASAILAAHRTHAPLWLAEIGYSSFRRGRFVSAQVEAARPYEHTEAFQATTLFRALALALASEKITLTTWYRINDLPPVQEVIGDENNRHLGVLDASGRAKPALKALSHFVALFGSGFRVCDQKLRVRKAADSAAEVHAFLLPDNRLIVVAWLRTLVSGTSGEAPAPSQTPRVEEIKLTLPYRAEPGLKVVDELATPRRSAMARQSSDGRRLTFKLSDEHVTVLVLQRKEGGELRPKEKTPAREVSGSR